MFFESNPVAANMVLSDIMIDMAKELPIVMVESDLRFGSNSYRFAEVYPDRFIECGIAEGNAVCVSAGLAANGLLPVVHSQAPFITRRACDQVVLSIAYAQRNVKVIASNPGIQSQRNGGTHLSVEDVAIMRTVPGFVVVDACDNVALAALLPQILRDERPVYLRFNNDSFKTHKEGTEFTLGKAVKMKDGDQATIFANGIMVEYARAAADELSKQGIEAALYDMHTVKPIDEEAILKAMERGPIVTVENSSVINGLGSAVAEVIASTGRGCKLKRVGIQDRFGVVGTLESITEELKMQSCDIVEAVKKAIG